MRSIVLVPLCLVAACDLSGGERADTGKCPELYCSDATPNGLHFYGDEISEHDWFSDLFIDGPAPTAVGGFQHVTIAGLDGAAFGAGTDGANGISVIATDADTTTVTLRGVGDGSDYLRITDPVSATLYDRKRLYGATVQSIELEPIEYEFRGDATAWAFLPDATIAIALWGNVTEDGMTYRERLVDVRSTIDLPAEIQRVTWDSITVPAVTGITTITVHAGSAAPVALDVNVVDGIDTIAAYSVPDHLVVDGLASVCFLGLSGGAPVAGLTWVMQVDGVAASGLAPNCVLLQPKVAGTTTVVATAGGLQNTVHLDVLAAAAAKAVVPPAPEPHARGTSAGERALATASP